MSMSDTAEYWWDVKSSRGFHTYTGPEYYHIPGVECGRKHWNTARRIDDVNCDKCLALIANGFDHKLPEGKTDFRSRSERMRDEAKLAHKERIEKTPPVVEEDKPKCSCGANMVKRLNKLQQKYFYGCKRYPVCKNTQPYKDEKV